LGPSAIAVNAVARPNIAASRIIFFIIVSPVELVVALVRLVQEESRQLEVKRQTFRCAILDIF
jgi:hypothetical protein